MNELAHTLHMHGDNSASISVAKTGKNPTMRHMGRTHGVSLSWLTDEIKQGRLDLGYIKTDRMAADIFTKFYPKAKKETWKKMCMLVSIHKDSEFRHYFGTAGVGHETAMARLLEKRPNFDEPIAAMNLDYQGSSYHRYLSEYNPFCDQEWSKWGAEPVENHRSHLT